MSFVRSKRKTLADDRCSRISDTVARELVGGHPRHILGVITGAQRAADARTDVIDDHEVVHISFSGSCDAMGAMLSFLNSELGNSVTILPTIYPHMDFTLIDILPPNTTKGTGLEKLAEIEGMGREDVMVVGDNFNDLGMLEFAGTPVVMGNADTKLLERTEFYKTDTNDRGGVAAAIRKYILEKET